MVTGESPPAMLASGDARRKAGTIVTTPRGRFVMLRFDGGFLTEWGDPDLLEPDCLHKTDTAALEPGRIRD